MGWIPFLELESEADSIVSLHRAILFVPCLCASISFALLLPRTTALAWLRNTFAQLRPEPRLGNDACSHPVTNLNTDTPSHLVRSLNGRYTQNSSFLWNVSRLLSCIVLAVLTVAAAALQRAQDQTTGAEHPHRDINFNTGNNNLYLFASGLWPEATLCLCFAYATFLAALTLTPIPNLQGTANHHLGVLLFVAFIALTWCDLFLLATYQAYPIALVSNWLTRTRVGIISFSSLLVPLCSPRSYKYQVSQEFDPPNPEETASIASLTLYNFISPLIWTAYRSSKLNYDQLPSLARYDRADFLRQRSFAKLDPLKHTERHLFWGIIDVFRKEYYMMAGMIIIKVLTELAGPIGIRYILKYLEDPFQPGYFHPWVWILWLFLGPIIGAIAMQWYVFTTTGMVVRIEAMVTQLLFEHSLRIRMASEDSIETNKYSPQSTGSEGIRPNLNKEKQNLSSSHILGRIHNLISTDSNNISQDFLFVLFFAPLRVVFNGLFLYWILGWSAIIGLFSMIGLLLIPGQVVRLINKIQVEWAKRTDARVQLIVESLNIIRTIKLFAWENRVKNQSEKKRQEELDQYRKRQFLGLVTTNINFALPLVVMIITFASHTLLFKRSLDASSIFSSIAVFDTLRTQLRLLFFQIPSSIQSKVSFDRMNDFFQKAELLDSYSGRAEAMSPSDSAIGFSSVTFTWSTIQTGSQQGFQLRIDSNLLFQRGRINMVIGPTGCGKTSLLMALLGELHYVPNGPDSWVSLPGEKTAYAAQEAWIQNATIKENILFGTEHDEQRYKKVVFQCGLETDLKLLKCGDQTEVGEKGVTLSGGQRARVSLARAIYSKAEIIILDDVLSALDVHTSRWVVDECFRGDLAAGRTWIIATHNVAMVSEVADFIVVLGHGGRILNQGSVEAVLGSNSKLKEKTGQWLDDNSSEPVDEETTETVTEQTNTDIKLAAAEEVAKGHVGWSALRMFFLALGGIGFWIAYLAGFILANVAALLQTYWLGIWARAYGTDPSHLQKVNVFFYLGVYGSICLCGMILYSLAFIVHISGSIRASRRIHNQLVLSVFSAPLYWLDSTPIGRIIARFTQDVRAVDGALPNQLQNLTDMTIQLFSRFIAIIIVSPAFTFAGASLLALGIWIGQVYITAQLSVKRHMSNARSPMFSYFHAALAGIPTIRAYGAQEMMRKEIQKRIDMHTRAARTFWNLNRWVAIRMEALGGLFSASLAAWLVYVRKDVDSSDAGFSLNMAIALSGHGGILWWVRAVNEFQVQTNSLERIHSYLVIPHEPRSEEYPAPPAYWPSSGSLVVHNLNAQYTPDGSQILHNISFEVKHGQRIGIVGRTGSGKSSLVLALLRMIQTSGEVYYDGTEIHSIPLETLRSNVTVVPQQPELSSGTVRENLDPFNEWQDAVLWDALRAVGLADSGETELDASRTYIRLDTPISPGGSNLSLGQRQMVALARAIVRRTKLVVLDEATAAIDHETGHKIHHALGSLDQTVLIVAHRLRTICNVDKVMVLDAGRLVEFDSPQALLQKGGAFKSLVDESGEKSELYALIEKNSLVG